jgi:hypothetical protein
MPESGSERRNSRALEAPLIADPKARAAAEARNGFRQYDAGIKTVQTALERGVFKLRLSLILALIAKLSPASAAMPEISARPA